MSKIVKRLASALLAVSVVTAMFSGCGDGGKKASSGTTLDKSSTRSTSEGAEQANTGNEDSNDEIVKLNMWTAIDSSDPGVPAVAEAISKITREKIGVEIEIIGKADAEKMNLAMTSGEDIDLMTTHGLPGAGLTYVVSNGYARPIDDLIEQYAQDALAIIPEDYLKCGQVNGITYTLPHLKDTARAAGVPMRMDVLNELNINPDTIKTWDDVHEVLLKVQENRPDLYPLVSLGGWMQETIPIDDLGGGYGVLENVFSDSTEVVDFYESNSYKEFCERMYQWNQEGLIMPDATTTSEYLIGTLGFASLENIKPGKGIEIPNYEDVGGYALIDLTTPYTYTNMIGGSSFVIPNISGHPEKSIQLLNLMFTDAKLSTLFVDGIEEVNYVYTDDSRTVIKIPEELDDKNSYPRQDWAWPNMRITPALDKCGADIYDQIQIFCDNARKSPALGFRFETSGVLAEITACDNVVAKYDMGLRWGELNPDEALPQFVAELKATGVDTIVAEKQAQLDTWLAENK